jgi:KUP system potassium uptake protein
VATGSSTVPPSAGQPRGRRLWLLALLALGVVYGDIGTSPLYALGECFGAHGVPAARAANVLGVLSLVDWSLILAVSLKYLGFVLRADNRGEGGILALGALVAGGAGPRLKRALTVLGLAGGAFLVSDGMITPAISVLGAMEGLAVSQPGLAAWIVPLTVAILVALFAIQRHGTAAVGAVFGPVTLLYFLTIAALGAASIVHSPAIIAALDPREACAFLAANGWTGYLVVGSVFLVVTGGEALFADLGHFGRRPIRLAWFLVALPALLLAYHGQGALLLRDPAVANPYYQLAPRWAQLPLLALSVAAAVIASQAVISGVFSLAAQAIQLGFWPRMAVRHTSASAIGQVYLPAVNWALMVCCVGLVVGFGSSGALAAAYGVAIAITMVVTTVLLFFAARQVWRWPLAWAAVLAGGFLAIDLAFLGATLGKIPQGGWFPLLVTGVIYALMSTWNRGRRELAQRLGAQALPLADFRREVRARPPLRVPGIAVFMTGNASATPSALLHNLKHNRVLHRQVVVLRVETLAVPVVAGGDRHAVEECDDGIVAVTLRCGFKEQPDVPALLAATPLPFAWAAQEVSYFLGRETLVLTSRGILARWRGALFASMSRNARSAAGFFALPADRVVELGMHVQI